VSSSQWLPKLAAVLFVCCAGRLIAAEPVSYEDLLGIVDLGVTGARGAGQIAIAPDESVAAVEVRTSDWRTNRTSIRWLSVPLHEGGRTIDLGDGGEPIPFIAEGTSTGFSPFQIPLWWNDSQSIVFRARVNGETQLWRSWRNEAKREKLTSNASDVESFEWSADGRKIFFLVGPTRRAVLNGLRDEGALGYHYDERFDLLNSRQAIPFDSFTTGSSNSGLTLWVYLADGGIERLATDSDRSEYKLLQRRQGERAVAVGFVEDTRRDKSLGVDPPMTLSFGVNSGRPIHCDKRVCTGHFRGVWTSADKETVFALRWAGKREFGALLLFSWMPRSGRVAEILRTGDFLDGCALVITKLVCGRESAVTPTQLVSIDLKNGFIATLYDANQNFQQRKFGRVEELTWTDNAGIEGFGHLVYPIDYVSGRRYPLIIVQYRSRGFLRGGVGDEYPVHVFSAKGFAVLSFDRPDDLPSLSDSRSFEEAKVKGWVDFSDRRRVLSVLEAGIDLLVRAGIVDPARVGITGLSDGAETLGFALIHSTDRFAAASTSGEFWNPIVYSAGGPRLRARLNSWGFVFPDQGSATRRWAEVSIALNADKGFPPLLIQVSDAEILPELQTFAALREYGKAVDMYVFPDEFHVKAQPAHRSAIYRRNVQWFQFWLQGLEDQNPLDREQYKRWRGLRAK
jgi:dipeptidyl aminopeptidase/acylaminoacyl peptidase